MIVVNKLFKFLLLDKFFVECGVIQMLYFKEVLMDVLEVIKDNY